MKQFYDTPLRRLRVESFRGFRDFREFDLSASAVIVTGPNGTGKTSFFDALQWCLLGSIVRLEDLRARRNVEHIVNQYRLAENAIVEVDMVLKGRQVTVRRSGNHAASTLELRQSGMKSLFGREAEESLEEALVGTGELSLSTALSTSGLMQQDVMRAVLEAKPSERYRHLTSVLGLGSLEDFEDATRGLAKAGRERAEAARAERDLVAHSLDNVRRDLSTAEQRVAARPDLEILRRDLVKLSTYPSSYATAPRLEAELASTDRIRALVSAIGAIQDQLGRYVSAANRARSVAVPEVEEPTDADSERAKDAASSARDETAAAKSAVEDARRRLSVARANGQELARLAAAAIPLLSSACPVCGQDIDPGHVEGELLRRAEEAGTLVALTEEVSRVESALRDSQQREMETAAAVRQMQTVAGEWSTYRSASSAAAQALEALVAARGPIEVRFDEAANADLGLDATIAHLEALQRRVLDYAAAMERASDQGAVDRARSEMNRLEAALSVREERLKAESQRSAKLKHLADTAIDARVEVTQRRFQAVQPLVADIYSRLDPHPAFKTMEFEHDTYYRRGTTVPMVHDPVANVSADPLLVLSTSQANIAALSYFLAVGLTAGHSRLPFVLLDDPVQSMDDINVLGFADLCRFLRSTRQLIISTHDRRFARLLERKLSPRDESETCAVIEFGGWDRSGPAVRQRNVEPQLLNQPIRVVRAAS